MAAESAVLSQQEIDALLNADSPDSPQADAQAAVASQNRRDTGRRIKLYDFRHPEKLSKEQVRGLQIIQQGVASALAQAFSTRLRSQVDARLSALERGIYEEYSAQISASSIVAIIDMAPLHGYAMAAFGLDVAFGIIDRLLGGKGKQSSRALTRDLTDIETALIRHVGMDIANSLVEPWGRVCELSPDVTELALGPQLMHAVAPSEFVITAWYEIRIGEQTGGISLCFPLTILEQILPRLAGTTLFDNRPGRAAPSTSKVQEQQLFPMQIPLRATLGTADIPVQDIANLQPGDVIVLDREAHEPLRVRIGNCEKFAAFPGTRGRKMALQISGIIDEDGWVQPFGEEAV